MQGYLAESHNAFRSLQVETKRNLKLKKNNKKKSANN